jgi:hypothetical protein
VEGKGKDFVQMILLASESFMDGSRCEESVPQGRQPNRVTEDDV